MASPVELTPAECKMLSGLCEMAIRKETHRMEKLKAEGREFVPPPGHRHRGLIKVERLREIKAKLEQGIPAEDQT